MTSKYSKASCYAVIKNDLMPSGLVIQDSKDGHKIRYAVSGMAKDNGNGIKPVKIQETIMSLTPAERFEYVANLTDMVIGGVTPSLLVTGIAGIGKTYIVKNRFIANDKLEGDDYHFISGHSSPLGLYRFLYEHQDSTIVFDDCDSVFKDETAVNILKSALDSYAVRKINWLSGKLPEDLENSFEFEGQIIFISNMNSSRIDEAVKSRTMVIDLQMSRKEICDHIETIATVIEPKISLPHKLEVLNYLRDISDRLDQMNIRTFIKACRIRKCAESKNTDWKKMILILN